MKNSSLFSNIYNNPYGLTQKFKLFYSAKNSKEFVQKLQLQRKIPVHSGCVNSICWNETGSHILSGSDDQRLAVVNGYDYSVSAFVETGHRANIFSAKFLPCSSDTQVVSCSGDGIIIYSDLNRPTTSLDNKFLCHRGTAYEIMTVPNDSNTFLSCGEDRTVRWFDIRTKTSCPKDDCREDVLINCQAPVTALAVNAHAPYQLAVGSADATVRIFDRRMLSTQNSGLHLSDGYQALLTCFTVSEFEQSRRITSLCYSPDGREMLVSYSSDYIYLFDVKDDVGNHKLFSKNQPSTSAESSNEDSGYRPLMKRLRIRGDWSDTGPNARPESEAREVLPEAASRNSIVRTMTDILTRMFNTTSQNAGAGRPAPPRSPPASSHGSSSEDNEGAGASDEDMEERPIAAFETPLDIVLSSNPPVEPSPERAPQEEPPSDNGPVTDAAGTVGSSDLQPAVTSSAFEVETDLNHIDLEQTEGTSHEMDSSVPTQSSKNAETLLDHQERTPVPSSSSGDSDVMDETIEDIGGAIEEKKQTLARNDADVMVNLHYSGQSVNSGLITMDVANSSTPNERQWLEQTTSDIPELPSLEQSIESNTSGVEENQHSSNQPNSSDSETEAAVQTIQPNYTVRNPMYRYASDVTADDDLELMVEVDSCSWDSEADEDNRCGNRGRGGRRSKCDKHSDDFMCSLNAKVKAANDRMKKEEITSHNVSQPRVKRKFTGHRNARTMIKESTFWGDNFIMSGSDCGHIFIWDRYTTELVMLMEADHHVVNCLQPHPFDPILASSGIDYDIKIWAPTREEPFFDTEKASEIIKRNEVMLEETKDTITVPASFMFRMFTSLSNFRTGRAYRWSRVAREMRAARERGNSESSRR